MKKILGVLALSVGLFFGGSSNAYAASSGSTCPAETSEERITEILTPEDKYQIIEGEALDLFIKNANELYNIGWQRNQIAKVWAIEAVKKHPHERYQTIHLFFIDNDGCIGYYQTTYSIVVQQLLDPDPASKRGVEPVYPENGSNSVVISDVDPGGSIQTYHTWYQRFFTQTTEKLVIDAPCISACTIFLAYLEANPDRVCVTSRASLGFHLGSWGDDSELNKNYTKMFVRMYYPQWIQQWIASVGGLKEDLKMMYPEDMEGRIPLCDGNAYSSVPVDDLIEKEPTIPEPKRLPAPGETVNE